MDKKRLGAELLLLLTAVIGGFGFIVAKASFDSITPMFVIAFRFTVAAAAISLVFFRRFKKMNVRLVGSGIILGVTIFVAFVCMTVGLKYTTASKNAFLLSAHVVIVPFMYWLISRKRPTVNNVAAAVTAMVGIGLLSLNSDLTVNMGDALSLLSSVFFALHFIAVSHMNKKYDPVELTMVQLITDAALSCAAAFLFERFPTGLTAANVGGMVFLGLFCTFLAYLFQNVGQKYTSPSSASLLLCLESPSAALLSVWLLGERLSLRTAAGCAVMFAALVISESTLMTKREKNEKGAGEIIC